MRCLLPTILVLLALLFSGCGDEPEPVVYTIPKDAPTEATPSANPGEARQFPDMSGRQLPAEALNADSANPAWVLPADWEELPASSMRRASFAARGSAGAVDIAVTTFPGDVGGLLANINRWRGQIGLGPLTGSQIGEVAEEINIHGKTATVVRMDGAGQSTHAAIFMDAGNSWFFKMTGPLTSVAEQADAFDAFIQTVQFPSDE